MERMTPEQLIEQSIYSLSQKLGDDNIDVRSIAFALYSMTHGSIENLPERYKFTDLDAQEYMNSVTREELDETYQEPELTPVEHRQDPRDTRIQPAPQRPIQNVPQAGTRDSQRSQLVIPFDVQELKKQPLVPETRVNGWYDDGRIEAGMKQIDKKIVRPEYQHGRRPPAAQMMETRCRVCRGDFSVEQSDFDEFSGRDQLYEFGYVCAGCARNEVLGGGRR